jgi:hypothetical protein
MRNFRQFGTPYGNWDSTPESHFENPSVGGFMYYWVRIKENEDAPSILVGPFDTEAAANQYIQAKHSKAARSGWWGAQSLAELLGQLMEEGETRLVTALGLDEYLLIPSVLQVLQAYGFQLSSETIASALSNLARGRANQATRDAVAGLEAIVRKVSGRKGKRGRLSKIIYDLPLPRPIQESLDRIWGYASEYARHGSEDKVIELDEAKFVVGLCVVSAAYLASKYSQQPDAS